MVDVTIAKEIALYFIGKAKLKYDGKSIRINISIAKSILEKHTKEDIISVIDYLIDVDGAFPNSLALVRFTIDDKLKEIEEKQNREDVIQRYKESITKNKNFGGVDTNANDRNKRKNIGASTKSRVGEGDYKHLFEKRK
jgi:hypothetical protein